MEKAIAVKIEHYNGLANPWNEAKEFSLPLSEVETIEQGGETTHWQGQQRIVLKSSWEQRQMKDYIVTVQHDNGKAKFRITAATEEVAKKMVMKMEGCPPSAITSVKPAAYPKKQKTTIQ